MAAPPVPQFSDPKFWDDFFDEMSSTTTTLPALAEQFGVIYSSVYWQLRNKPELKARLDEARKAQAMLHASKVSDTLERLQTDDKFDTGRARELMRGHQWMAGKLDRETFGDDKQPLIQVNFDTAGLNALRALAATPPPMIEGEFTEVGGGAPDLDKLLE